VRTAAEKCIDAAGRRNPAGVQSELHWALTNEVGSWHAASDPECPLFCR